MITSDFVTATAALPFWTGLAIFFGLLIIGSWYKSLTKVIELSWAKLKTSFLSLKNSGSSSSALANKSSSLQRVASWNSLEQSESWISIESLVGYD